MVLICVMKLGVSQLKTNKEMRAETMELQPYTDQFQRIVIIIEKSRENAHKKINEELMRYRDLGKYISGQLS